jgi:hypothetical protein
VQIEERRANEWTDMDSFFEQEEEDMNTALEKSRKRRSNGALIGSEINGNSTCTLVLDDVMDTLAKTQLAPLPPPKDNAPSSLEKKKNPVIPPRRSSMPLPPPKDLPTPPLPKDAKKKILTSYARRPSRATVEDER